MAALKWKSYAQRLRVMYSSDPGGTDVVINNPGKVFAIIGPFEDPVDKAVLQDALEMLVRGFNLEET